MDYNDSLLDNTFPLRSIFIYKTQVRARQY